MNAFDELTGELRDGEELEAIAFGPWGWGYAPSDDDEWELGYAEPDPPPVPFVKRGKPLDPEEAKQYMDGWSFRGGVRSA